MNTNKAESLRNQIPISGSVPENIFSHYKAEQDNNESNGDYQTRIVRARLSGQTITDSFDFNIPLTDTSLKISKFHRSFFTIWLNFRIYMMSMGNVIVGIPVKLDGIPAWLDHFGVDLTKQNMKYEIV
jgi:hypothetical protein